MLITKNATNDYLKDFFLYDQILIKLFFTKIENTFTDLKFEFYEKTTMELRSVGTQRIVFADSSHKICRIPENFKNAIMKYMELQSNEEPALTA